MEGTLQKEPFTFNVITKDGELDCAINLIQCLVESPFHQDLEPQFSKLRALARTFNKEDHLEVSFENCEVPLLNCFEEPPLLSYSNIAQPTKHRVTYNIPLFKHFSKNSVNLLATEGYDTLGHLDLQGDHLFVIIKDFNSAFDLVDLFNKHLFASTFTNRLHVIVDTKDSTLATAIRHLFRNRVSIEVPVHEVRISQGLEAFKLLKKSPSNASLYQYGWTHSGMLALHNTIKNKLNLNELKAAKEQRNASVQQHFIRLAKQNLMTRLKHSDSLLKASKDTLEALAFLEADLTQGFETTLATLKLETNSIIAKLSPRKLAFIRIPKYLHKIHLLLPEVPFYETEVTLAEYQGFSRAQLKKFWDSNSAALVNLASDRPNIVLPKVELDLPILHQEVRLMRGTLDLNSIVEALSEYQEQLYLRVSAAIGGGCLAGYSLFSTLPDPYFPYTVVALAYTTLYVTFKSYGTWCTRMDELESRIKSLDQDFASKTTLVFQSQLEAVRSPLTTLINGNIKPFHEQLSARIKTQLSVADSLGWQNHSK
ncbi:hypothetical protein DSO57_1030571 [Entomophthora muscae]|uniref:Uncharacterized protein n=1 Tax=Entomophthora muscae TaxID=34485 RepID=A0ACC2ULL7_9FUNG|nr:hypothetical protein DSO57_1030571 [Entomophthora muscae]